MTKEVFDKEWHPTWEDYSKVEKCIACRFPPHESIIRKKQDHIYTCRECARCEIKVCVSCGKEMGYCTLRDVAPDTDLDKKHKCIRFVPR